MNNCVHTQESAVGPDIKMEVSTGTPGQRQIRDKTCLMGDVATGSETHPLTFH